MLLRSRSHIPLWDRHWDALADGQTPDGYLGPTMDALKAEREPIECHGPAGTVVLWHGTVARKQISIPSRFAALSVSLTLESITYCRHLWPECALGPHAPRRDL